MQEDFHYYCIAVLARAAGFDKEDALTIAYASQYVDNATESELIRLEIRGGDLKFDPVRTAYAGLDLLGALAWSAQKRVHIPFHFIPPKPFRPEERETFSFATEPGSPFAQLLLDQAASEDNRKRRLCRLGIALHTYADTWAHQRFSGRQNRDENDVENIHVYDRESDKYDHLSFENVIFDILPQIGHAEAGYFPDLAYQKWKYDSRQSPDVERDNIEEFLKAAETIYDQLRKMTPTDPILQWEDLEQKVRKLFEGGPEVEAGPADRLTSGAHRAYHALDVQKRCERWKKAFRHLFDPHARSFSYDRETWRKKAVKGDTDWDDWTQRDWDQMLPLKLRPNFWDSLWVHFHRAALRQRHLVLENLP